MKFFNFYYLGFHWKIRGILIQPNKNRSPCLPFGGVVGGVSVIAINGIEDYKSDPVLGDSN